MCQVPQPSDWTHGVYREVVLHEQLVVRDEGDGSGVRDSPAVRGLIAPEVGK